MGERVSIRQARTGDIDRMRAVEVDAGERFREIGLHAIADDDPPTAEALARYIELGTAWVAELNGIVVGYASASVVDGEGHLDQVSLISSAAGRGIGKLLIDAVCSWTRDSKLAGLTLTTFRDVAWNGPYYQRLGFAELGESDLGPQLAAIREAERNADIDIAPRIAMRRKM